MRCLAFVLGQFSIEGLDIGKERARAEAALRAGRLVWTAVVISADYKAYDIAKVCLMCAAKSKLTQNLRVFGYKRASVMALEALNPLTQR